MQRRRRQTRTRAESARRAIARRRRNVRLFAGGLVMIVLVGIVGAVWLLRDNGASTPNYTLRSELVAQKDPPIAITADPATYTVTYRVESFQQSDATTSTEQVTIRRPFDGRVTFRKGEPPGNDLDQEFAGAMTTLSSASTGGAPDTNVIKPAPAVGDLRLDASLEDLIGNGMFQPREKRRVIGRDCTVYRTGEIVQTLTVADATDQTYADVCIDDAGLLLEEFAVQGGTLVLRVTAVDMQINPTIDDATFVLPGVATSTDQSTSLTAIPATTAPAQGYWQLSAVPEGYTLRGRFDYRQPATNNSTTTTTTQAATTTTLPTSVDTYFDIYSNGTRALIIHQGPSAGAPSVDTSKAKQVDAGALGSGSLVSGLLGTTVTTQPTADWFVHVTATLPASAVEPIVRTLQKV